MNENSLPAWEQIPDIELYMDQVLALLNKYTEKYRTDGEDMITASMLNNYVKQKLLPPPVKKKYTREHVAFFCMICILKRVLTITQIKELLEGLKEEAGTEELYTHFSATLSVSDSKWISSSPCAEALYSAVNAFISVKNAEEHLAFYTSAKQCTDENSQENKK